MCSKVVKMAKKYFNADTLKFYTDLNTSLSLLVSLRKPWQFNDQKGKSHALNCKKKKKKKIISIRCGVISPVEKC